MFKEKSLFLAPMEGITDSIYRKVVGDLYPEWDYMACDFLRVPSGGRYPKKHLRKHFGSDIFESEFHQSKTIYQILTSAISKHKEVVQDLDEIGIKWIDLNLGCPSKQVVKRKGGSYLLSELPVLREIIKEIRESFPHRFTAKIRVGFKDDQNFEQIIELLNEEKVDAITIHGRTREELYKGIANWDYIKRAVEISSVPIIGNGDIWTQEDIDKIISYTGCNSVMIARGAMKRPWLAKTYKNKILEDEDFIRSEIKIFLRALKDELERYDYPEKSVLSRYKSLTRYAFDDLHDGEDIKKNLLRSQNLEQYLKHLNKL